MKKLLVISSIIGLGLVLISSSFVSARGGKRHGSGHQRGQMAYKMLLDHADEIGLSENQLTEMKQIFLASEKNIIKLKADRKILELDMRAEMENDTPDKKKVSSYIEKMNSLDGKIKKATVMRFIDIKSILTSEQMDKIKELRQEKRKEFRKRRSHRGGMRHFQREDSHRNESQYSEPMDDHPGDSL